MHYIVGEAYKDDLSELIINLGKLSIIMLTCTVLETQSNSNLFFLNERDELKLTLYHILYYSVHWCEQLN